MSESRPEKRKVEFIESYWTGGELGANYQWNDNHGELIRCKDCKHQDPDRFDDGEGNYVCRKGHGWKPDDWFCADGERGE